MPPATLTVLVIVLALLGLGVIMIASALRPAQRGPVCPAQACGHRNRPGARYCSRCGTPLGPGP
jgi:hypothetical protein